MKGKVESQASVLEAKAKQIADALAFSADVNKVSVVEVPEPLKKITILQDHSSKRKDLEHLGALEPFMCGPRAGEGIPCMWEHH